MCLKMPSIAGRYYDMLCHNNLNKELYYPDPFLLVIRIKIHYSCMVCCDAECPLMISLKKILYLCALWLMFQAVLEIVIPKCVIIYINFIC